MIQIDIDLPNRCDECPLVTNGECPLIGIDVDEEMGSRDLNCPLKEVNDNSVLEQIKDEIEEKGFNSPLMNPVFTMTEILEIIDKYISRKEEQGEAE